jgi:hypothetical protein
MVAIEGIQTHTISLPIVLSLVHMGVWSKINVKLILFGALRLA